MRSTQLRRRPRFLLQVGAASVVALAGFVVLGIAGALASPLRPIVEVHGIGGSKARFFEDPVIREILLRNNMRVTVSDFGSRQAARALENALTTDRESVDFVFSSTQASAELTKDVIAARGEPPPDSRKIFTSPVVLASYRPYAELLEANEIATQHPGTESQYYTVDLARFLELGVARTTWAELSRHPAVRAGATAQVPSGRIVLAQTTDMCTSSGGGTFAGLVAWQLNGNAVVQNEEEADRVAAAGAPLLREQGQPLTSPFEQYTSPQGPDIAPITVLYEHQYLEYQAGLGTPDDNLVLLYPDVIASSEPDFIARTEQGRALGQLLTDERSGIGHRATELGYRVFGDPGDRLDRWLLDRTGGAMSHHRDLGTVASMPDADLMDRIIRGVGGC
ncbi:hypothetical protein GCM10027436_62470 [Actinophytocola sediminis]